MTEHRFRIEQPVTAVECECVEGKCDVGHFVVTGPARFFIDGAEVAREVYESAWVPERRRRGGAHP